MVLEDLFCRPSTLARFRLAPLGPVMDGFCECFGAGISLGMQSAVGSRRHLISTAFFDDEQSKIVRTWRQAMRSGSSTNICLSAAAESLMGVDT